MVRNKGLVKTVKFNEGKYVGDPLNAVKIFNEKEVDELIVIDIDATVQNREPDYKLIEDLAVECRMPLCYGGGIKTVDQAKRIISLGVEKIAISSVAIENPSIIEKFAQTIGSQSVVVVLDTRKKRFGNKYEIFIYNGKKSTKHQLTEFALKVEDSGAGEIVINSIDRDGMMEGYDFDLVDQVRNIVKIPITVLGGAGSHKDISELINQFGILGAAAGSLFVFKGPYKAVLINYPDLRMKTKIDPNSYKIV